MGLETIRQIGPRDVVDVVVVAYLVYRMLLLIRGTRAIQILVGLAAVFVVFFIAEVFDLVTLHWLLSSVLSSLFLVVIVLFQAEIRRALSRVGKNPFGAYAGAAGEEIVEELARAANTLANRRIGAILVAERETGLSEYIEDGVKLDAKVSRDLIVSIFLPTSPIHDGALIVRRGRIVAAGCFFPLATDVDLARDLGTRHRAAIGISEESDAVVLVVSEERGEISLVVEGKTFFNLDAEGLRQRLQDLLG
jgi:uncharacterized protein (TIGR00159 family)